MSSVAALGGAQAGPPAALLPEGWEPHFQTIWQSALDGMRLADAEGQVLLVNDAYCRLMGMPREGLAGHPMSAPYLAKRREEILRQHCERFRARSVPPQQEVEVTLADGRHLFVELSNSFLESPGQPVWLLSVFRDVTARKEAEAGCRREAQRLRMALEAAGMVAWEWDVPAGTIRYSENLPEIVRGENVAPYASLESVLQQVHPEDRDKLVRALARTQAEGCPFECEYRVRMLDGQWRWILGLGKTVVLEEGRPVRVQGLSQDITARKLAEQKRRDSEERFQSLVNNLNVGVYRNTPGAAGRFLEANPALVAMFGYESMAELQQVRVCDLYQQPAQRIALVRKIRRQGSVRAHELDLKRKDGTPLRVAVTATAHRAADGTLEWMDGIVEDITERKRSDEALRVSEQRLRAMFDQALVGFAQCDLTGRFLDVNDCYARMFGYAKDELRQRWLEDVTAAGDQESVRARLAALLEGGPDFEVDLHQLRRDGADLFCRNWISALRDAAGQPQSLLVVAVDRTDRRLVEARLQASELRFRTLFEQSPIAIWEEDFSEVMARFAELAEAGVLDFRAYFAAHPEEVRALAARVRVVEINQRSAEVLGLRDKPGTLGELAPYFTEDSWRVFEDELIALAEGQTWFEAELQLRNAAGQRLWLQLNLSVQVGYEEDLSRVLVSFVDITQRKAAEQALRASEERHRRLLEILPDSCLVLDREGKIVSVNQRTLALHGVASASEIVGHEPGEFIAPEELPKVRERLRRATAGEPLEPVDYTFRRQDGTTFPAEVCTTVWRDAAGQVEGFITLGRDITERKRAELALREAKDRLEARVAERTAQLAAANEELRAVFDNAPFEFWVRDQQGKAIMQNRVAAGRYGMVVGQRAEETPVPPETLEIWQANNQRAFAGEVVQGEIALHEPGGVRWLHNVVAPFVVDGQVRGILGFNFDITERKRIEEALRQAEQRLRFQIAECPALIYSGQLELPPRATFVSENIRSVLGFEPAEITGDPGFWLRQVHPEDAPHVKASLAAVLRDGANVWEYRIRHKSGHYCWLRDHLRLIRDDRGQPVELLGCAIDITQSKQLETALRESEARYRRLHESMTDAFVSVRMTGELQDFNRAYREMLGYAEEELRRLTYVDLTPEKWHAAEAAIVQEQIVPRGHSEVYEKEYRRKDGTVFPVELRTFLLRDEAGQPTGMWAIVRDISRRKQAEEALRRSERRARAVLNASTEAVGLFDRAGNILAANQTLARRMELFQEGVEGKNIFDLLDLEVRARRQPIFDEAVRTGQPIRFEDERAGRWFDNSLFPIRDANGVVAEVAAFSRDITERRQAEQEIRQLNATLEQRVRERTVELEAANAELQESETRLRLTAEAGHVGLWDWNLQTNEVTFSPEWKRQLGYTEKEFPDAYAEWERRLHPEDRKVTLQELRKCLSEPGREYRVEFRLQHRDGSYRSILAQGEVVRDAAGQPLWMLGSHVDLTSKREAEDRIRKLSRAVEQSPAAIVITDAQGAIEWVNAKFTQVSGYRLEEVLGCNPRLLKSGATPPEEYARLWRTITGGGDWHGEFHNRKKNGELYWESALISPILDAAGRVTHFVALKEDITERKTAELNLAASELRFRTLFEAAPIAIALHSADGHFLQVNPAYAQMLGYPRGELARRGVRRVTYPADVPEGRRLHQELCAGTRDSYQRDKRFRRQDGRLVWAHSSAAAVREADGTLRYIISIVDDITEQKRVADRSAAFSKLGLALSAASTPSEAAQIIMDAASLIFEWDACFMNLVSAEDGKLAWLVHVDTIRGRKTRLPTEAFRSVPSPLTLEIMREGARLINPPAPAFVLPGVPRLSPFGDTARPSASMMYVPIRCNARSLGVLSLQSYTPNAYTEQDLATLQSLADHCGGALERIHAAGKARQLELEVLEAGNREQTRIGCELHDGLAQTLGGLALRAKVLQETLRQSKQQSANQAKALCQLLSEAMAETRRLARGLAPVGLELSGLPAALQRLCLDAATDQLTCPFTCRLAGAQIRPDVAPHLFRLAQEAVTNALRHAQASRVGVSLIARGDRLTLRVRDDGRGFAPASGAPGRMGLQTMKYRASVIGAELAILSQPGRGTEIRCVLPHAGLWQPPEPKEKNHACTRPPPRRPAPQNPGGG